MTKRQRIEQLLSVGMEPHAIAATVRSTLSYIYDIRKMLERGSGQTIRHYNPVDHVHMVFSPWTVEPNGILSREIRGT